MVDRRLKMRDSTTRAVTDRRKYNASQAPKDDRRKRHINYERHESTRTRSHYEQADESDDDDSRNDWKHVRQQSTKQRRSIDNPFCWFCGESGHLKDTCHHGKQVMCSTCNRSGHKAKFCHLY